MKRDVNEPMYRRGPSLYKPSTYCLHVSFLVAQENQAPGPKKNRLRGASNRLTRDSLVRSPSLQAVSTRVMERSTASRACVRVSPFLLRIIRSNRETVSKILPLGKCALPLQKPSRTVPWLFFESLHIVS